ncbi:hypothetical protein [Sphingomonas bacterium]|uniref:hypothetical protein n=1 Tax=Sphingomonas bacterium TaxID=1895847 RepID=UPI0015771A94|nr:hypothetical protein [Sphingomonas bacterium]
MASAASDTHGIDPTPTGDARRRPPSIGADGYERVLAWLSLALFAVALVAIGRGRAEWRAVPTLIWLHLATVLFATGLTPAILLGRRGTGRHRMPGRWLFG